MASLYAHVASRTGHCLFAGSLSNVDKHTACLLVQEEGGILPPFTSPCGRCLPLQTFSVMQRLLTRFWDVWASHQQALYLMLTTGSEVQFRPVYFKFLYSFNLFVAAGYETPCLAITDETVSFGLKNSKGMRTSAAN